MIHSDEVDAVFICSIGPVHQQQILAAMKLGKPVFCEKPLTPTAAEAQAVIDAEVAHGKTPAPARLLCVALTPVITS